MTSAGDAVVDDELHVVSDDKPSAASLKVLERYRRVLAQNNIDVSDFDLCDDAVFEHMKHLVEELPALLRSVRGVPFKPASTKCTPLPFLNVVDGFGW